MPNPKSRQIARRLGEGDYKSHALKRRMEDHVQRSNVKLFPVVVFEDDTAMSLSAYELLSNPNLYAQRHGGVWKTTLVSYDGFGAVIGEEPEIPRHLASPEELESLSES